MVLSTLAATRIGDKKMTIPVVPDYHAPYKPVPMVTPFTIRDNETMLKKVEGIKKYLTRELIPWIDANYKALGDAFEDQANALILQVNTAINAVINDSVDVQDFVVAGILDNAESATRGKSDLLYAAKSIVDTLEELINTGRLSEEDLTTAFASKTTQETVETGRLSDNAITARIKDLIKGNALDGSGIVYLNDFPREGAETHDSARFTRALAHCAANGATILEIGAETDIVLESQVNVNVANLTIRGAGKTATRITVVGNVIGLNITGHYTALEQLLITTTTLARTVYPVKFSGVNQGRVSDCYMSATEGARVAGVYFTGGSMGVVENCIFNHANIRVETWDVKVTNCYIWAMSCDFGIGVFNGTGNFTAIGVDVVPPLTSNPNGICGILIDGATGNPFNAKLSNIYLDGNPGLAVREGIMIGDGAGAILINNVNANRMDSDCIVIDSAFNVVIDGYNGYTNNNQGNGSREIVIKKTGTQSVENIRLSNIQCLQTTAVVGTAASAIYVDDTVGAGQVSIDGCNIKQPGALGGYTLPEVRVPVSGGYPTQSIRGKGQGTTYSNVGSANVLAGATTLTINLGSPVAMAYRAQPSQIHLSAIGATLPAYRLTYNSDNQVLVTFASAFAADATVHWRVHLER